MSEGSEGVPQPGAADTEELSIPREVKPTYSPEVVSVDRIVPADRVQDRDQAIIRAVGETMVVLNKDAKRIDFFNERGERIERPGTELMIADWAQIVDGPWKLVRTEGEIPPGNPQYHTLDSIPSTVRLAGEALLEGLSEIELPQESWNIDTTNLDQVAIDVNDDAVVLSMPGTDSYIGFLRKDDADNPLSGANWRRVDSLFADASALPDVVNARIALIDQPDIQAVASLDNAYSVASTEHAIIISDPTGAERHRESLSNVGNNIAKHPQQSGTFYFCTEDADTISFMDTNTTVMRTQQIPLPEAYTDVHNLQLDPSGHFVSFASQDKFVLLRLDNGELKPIDTVDGVYHASIVYEESPSGELRAQLKGLNQNGHLVSRDVDFGPVFREIQREEAERRAAAVDVDSMTDDEREAERLRIIEERYEPVLGADRATRVQALQAQLEGVTTFEELRALRERNTMWLNNLQSRVSEDEVTFYRIGLEGAINVREEAMSVGRFSEDLAAFTEIIGTPLAPDSYVDATRLIEDLRDLQGKVPAELRAQLTSELRRFEQVERDFKAVQNERLTHDTTEILTQAQNILTTINTASALTAFEDGLPDGDDLQSLTARLNYLHSVSIPEYRAMIDNARRRIITMIVERSRAIAEREAERGISPTEAHDTLVQLHKDEIQNIIDSLRRRGLHSRESVNDALGVNDTEEDPDAQGLKLTYRRVRDAIEDLQDSYPGDYRTLKRTLGVSVARYIAEVERVTTRGEGGDQRPMVRMGERSVRVYEEKPKAKRQKERKATLNFVEDNPESGIGHLEILLKNGKTDTVSRRVFADHPLQGKYESGLVRYRLKRTTKTTMTEDDFLALEDDFFDWQKGEEKSEIRKTIKEKRGKVQEYHQTRPVRLFGSDENTPPIPLREAREQLAALREENKERARNGEPEVPIPTDENRNPLMRVEDEAWVRGYEEVMNEYAQYAADHHYILFSEIDKQLTAPEEEKSESIGYVPELSPYWTFDEQTEKSLELMAEFADIQERLQVGMINMRGHAGTGKDVLVEMFCNMTKRQYFAFNCSKWTDETDLSEAISLKDGSVITIPSTVYQAIQTSGAVLYFNEFNALPEPTQLYLNSLLDQKRELVLPSKGSIKAEPDVLMFSSMNEGEGYAGVNPIAKPVRDRLQWIDVEYPPLHREPRSEDTRAVPFSASEALRIARGVTSLEEFTYDFDMQYNDFVKMWDHFINGVDNGVADDSLTAEQRFDLETVFNLVQYSEKLRIAFVNSTKPKRAQVKIMPTDPQPLMTMEPITGRGLLFAAADLSNIPVEEKTTPGRRSAHSTAVELLQRRFLPKIADVTERQSVDTALRAWPVEAAAA